MKETFSRNLADPVLWHPVRKLATEVEAVDLVLFRMVLQPGVGGVADQAGDAGDQDFFGIDGTLTR